MTGMTAEEYFRTSPETNQLTELLDGEIVAQAAPSIQHQNIALGMASEFRAFVKQNGGKCKPFIAPTDVRLDDRNVVQPDVFITCKPENLTEQCLSGAPDFVAEIVSSNRSDDFDRKLLLYRQSGVREYWIVDPQHEKNWSISLNRAVSLIFTHLTRRFRCASGKAGSVSQSKNCNQRHDAGEIKEEYTMEFKKIKAEEWNGNIFEAIGKQWFLLTAGTPERFNTMTASWGMAGIMWNMPSVTCYVRKSRHTYGFMEEGDTFTLSFFSEDYRKALAFCGAHSGRECDKVKETGLTPLALDGVPAFAEAHTVFVCRKRYAADMAPETLPAEIRTQFYSKDAAHRLYIGEITAIYVKS